MSHLLNVEKLEDGKVRITPLREQDVPETPEEHSDAPAPEASLETPPEVSKEEPGKAPETSSYEEGDMEDFGNGVTVLHMAAGMLNDAISLMSSLKDKAAKGDSSVQDMKDLSEKCVAATTAIVAAEEAAEKALKALPQPEYEEPEEEEEPEAKPEPEKSPER